MMMGGLCYGGLYTSLQYCSVSATICCREGIWLILGLCSMLDGAVHRCGKVFDF